MELNIGIVQDDKSFTYQHCHGVMLVKLNKIAYELELSHIEYRLMGVLISFWNKQSGKAFPTIRLLAKYCGMSNSTVLKGLNSLMKSGLIVVVKNSKNNCQSYYINLDRADSLHNNSVTTPVTCKVTPCSTIHSNNKKKLYKQKEFKQNIVVIKNLDDVLKKQKTSILSTPEHDLIISNYQGNIFPQRKQISSKKDHYSKRKENSLRKLIPEKPYQINYRYLVLNGVPCHV